MTDQIFISYSKKDSDFAHKLADDLEAAGFKVWIDKSIGGGDLWRETIEKNLKAASQVIIVVSPNSMGSQWVQHEGSLAYGWGKKLYPILIEPTDTLPPWLEEYQWIDFVNTPLGTAFDNLVAALTPPNPIQDLLDQQVQAYQQTGELIGEAILRVIEENHKTLTINEEAQEIIEKSQQAIAEREQSELEKAQKLARTQWLVVTALAVGLFVVGILGVISFSLYRQSTKAEQSARGQYLYAQGQLEFDVNPILSLGLIMESYSLLSNNDTITSTLQEFGGKGRLVHLGNDVERIFSLNNNHGFLIDHEDSDGMLLLSQSEKIIELPGEVLTATIIPNSDVFLVDYVNSPSEFRLDDYSEVTSYPEDEYVDILSNLNSSFFGVVYEAPGSTEVRYADTGEILPVSDVIDDVEFSPMGFFFIIHYMDGSSQVRDGKTGEILSHMSGLVSIYDISPSESYFVVEDELRHTDDGSLVTKFSDAVLRVFFSPNESFVVVEIYSELPPYRAELVRIDTGEIVTKLSEIDISQLFFSPDENYVVIDYSDWADELRRTDNGQILKEFWTEVNNVLFSPTSSFFLVEYSDTYKEILVSESGTVSTIYTDDYYDNDLRAIYGNIAPILDFSYYVEYPYTFDLTQTQPGLGVNVLSVEYSNQYFPDATEVSFDPTESFFLLENHYKNYSEIGLVDTWEVVSERLSFFEDVTFSPDSSYFLGTSSDDITEIIQSNTGEHLGKITEPFSFIEFSSNSLFFALKYRDGTSAIWNVQDEAQSLVELEPAASEFYFDLENGYSVVLYSDGRADLLDLEWLQQMHGSADTMPVDDLLRILCKDALNSGWVDNVVLQSYLGSMEPQYCRDLY
jgi:WD40 repeat protein